MGQVACAVISLHYLQQAMRYHDNNKVIPTYYATFTLGYSFLPPPLPSSFSFSSSSSSSSSSPLLFQHFSFAASACIIGAAVVYKEFEGLTVRQLSLFFLGEDTRRER